ncbi:hypothetical protein ACLOJK_004671 [Asimina triloba]
MIRGACCADDKGGAGIKDEAQGSADAIAELKNHQLSNFRSDWGGLRSLIRAEAAAVDESEDDFVRPC